MGAKWCTHFLYQRTPRPSIPCETSSFLVFNVSVISASVKGFARSNCWSSVSSGQSDWGIIKLFHYFVFVDNFSIIIPNRFVKPSTVHRLTTGISIWIEIFNLANFLSCSMCEYVGCSIIPTCFNLDRIIVTCDLFVWILRNLPSILFNCGSYFTSVFTMSLYNINKEL